MSAYEDLQQYVGMLSDEAGKYADWLNSQMLSIGRAAVSFNQLTASTGDRTAGTVRDSYLEAQRQMHSAMIALAMAAEAGQRWCGGSGPRLVLKPKQR